MKLPLAAAIVACVLSTMADAVELKVIAGGIAADKAFMERYDPTVDKEEFEKELAQSDELQRELKETTFVCQKLDTLPPAAQGFGDQMRADLRNECLRNLRIVRREQTFRRGALAGGAPPVVVIAKLYG